MSISIISIDELNECPCGIFTDQVLFWDYPLSDFTHHQVLCRSCQKDLYNFMWSRNKVEEANERLLGDKPKNRDMNISEGIYIKPGYEELASQPLPGGKERKEYLEKAKGTASKIKRIES